VARVGPEAPGAPATPADPATLADPATPVGLVDPAGRVTAVDPGDMNRVAAATMGTAAVMALADLASQVVPVGTAAVMAPADLASQVVPVVRAGPAGMILAVPVGMILEDPGVRLRVPNPVVRVDPEGLGVQNPVRRGDLGNREATDLSLGQALLARARPVRMPMRLHLTAVRPVRMPTRLRRTAAGPVPMPALPHLTPADRRRDPTIQAVAACQEATRAVAPRAGATRAVAPRAEATRAVAARRAEATRRVAATDGGAELSRRADRKPVCLLTSLSYANL
jgi:hypothetical protein